MELNLAVLADAANRSDSGKINLLGVFHTLHAHAVPCQHAAMALVVGFVATPAERGSAALVGIRLTDPEAKPMLTLPDSPVEVPGDANVMYPSIYLIVNLAGMNFTSFGTHRFEITLNGAIVGAVPLHVQRLLLPPPQSAAREPRMGRANCFRKAPRHHPFALTGPWADGILFLNGD